MTTDNTESKHRTSPYDFFKTTDGLSIRYGHWPCRLQKKCGTILLLTGRREYMEKYLETVSELNRRGYHVYSMDWRGQGLSDRELPNRHKGFVGSYENYLADLDVLLRRFVMPEVFLPLVIIAHSMGGHIALRHLHNYPRSVDRAILISPMIDIITPYIPNIPRKLLKGLTRLAVRIGLGSFYTAGSGDYSAAEQRFENNRLTSDAERFYRERSDLAENPELALGGVTYGWLDATLESIDMITRDGFAGRIRTPILLISAAADRIVSNQAQQELCSRLPFCTFKAIPAARHEILNESDEIRNSFWEAFDDFIANQ